MQNRFNESGESYRISAGSDVSQAIDPSTGRLYSAGHVFFVRQHKRSNKSPLDIVAVRKSGVVHMPILKILYLGAI